MKNLFSFIIALISFITIANGQGQGKSNNMSPKINMDYSTTSLQRHLLKKDVLSMNETKSNLFNSKSTNWNFDTIVTYDTIGLKQRLTQIFDIHGNV